MDKLDKTIAVLIESLDGYYQSGVWDGIKKVSQERNVNVVALVGGSLEISPSDQYEPNRNVLYEIPKLAPIDGIIISGSLCSYVSKEKINKFISGYDDIPIVSILPLSNEIPAATIDNRSGMIQLANHLIEEHKCCNFAFVSGPQNNFEVADRLDAFAETLTARGIALPKESVFPGNFDRKSGVEAVNKIAKANEGKIPYDAIVCIDDETAFGVMETLKELGLSVPRDVLVVGFDNTNEGKCAFPPLTSVDQPLRRLGEEALLMLLEKLDGKDISQGVMLRTELVKRHSCGCFFDYDIPKGRIRKALLTSVITKEKLAKEDLYNKVLEFFVNTHEAGSFDKEQLRGLTYSFCEDVNTMENEKFLKYIRWEFRDSVKKGSKLIKLSQVLRVFWYYSVAHLTRERFAYADMLLSRASELRFDMLNQYESIKQLQVRANFLAMFELKLEISNAESYEGILDVMAKRFPDLGFSTFFLVQYKPSPTHIFAKSQLVLAVKNGKRVNIANDVASGILPQTVLGSPKPPFVIVTEPLYFRSHKFGVLYFVLDSQMEYDYSTFEILGKLISETIHTEQILRRQKEVQEREHSELEGVRHELELGSDIQRSFLPKTIYQPDGFNIAAVYEPAREVSGDFYDIYRLSDDKIVILIADVSGKDVSSALFMALTKTLLEVLTDNCSQNGEAPLKSVLPTNDYIAEYNEKNKGRFMFTTLLFGVLNPATGVFEYINAGHTPGFLLSNEGKIRAELKPTSPAIGICEAADFSVQSCVIEKGELLFLYTDGVTDTQNKQKKFYTSKRLREKLTERKFNSSQEAANTICDDVSGFRKTTDRFDDITIISIYRTE
jgi:serine phosphatase RsbU (regulator of sigma subunit)/DNA-binding LacI/PurR family transcriptional regulator